MSKFDDIMKAEQAADARRQNRAGGFSLMKDRDSGSHRLSNGVMMYWHIPRPEEIPTQSYDGVEIGVWPGSPPPGHFALEIDGKKVVFDAEDFRHWLRWA